MTPSAGPLASLVFWRALSLALAAVAAVLLALVLRTRPAELADTRSTVDPDARATMVFVEFLLFAEDQERMQLHGALQKMVAGETDFATTGRVEDVRRLCAEGGPLFERRELLVVFLEPVVPGEPEDDIFGSR